MFFHYLKALYIHIHYSIYSISFNLLFSNFLFPGFSFLSFRGCFMDTPLVFPRTILGARVGYWLFRQQISLLLIVNLQKQIQRVKHFRLQFPIPSLTEKYKTP